MTLRAKTTKGVAWVFGSSIVTRILNFIITLTLVRILSPEDFGLFSVAMVVINLLDLFSGMGIGSGIIQNKKKEEAANTGLILLPFIGLFLTMVAFFAAPFVATFYESDALINMMRVLGVSFFLTSLKIVPSSLLEKELRFKRRVVGDIIPLIFYGGVAIFLGYSGYGVWALIWGQMSLRVIEVFLLWYLVEWKPTFSFDMKMAKQLLGYGINIIAGSFFVFLILNGDTALIGKVIGFSAVGFYSLAYNLAAIPSTAINQAMNRVLFPTYSLLANEKEKLRKTYLIFFLFFSVCIFPMTFGLFFLAKDITTILYGVKWLPIAVPLQILCFFNLIRGYGGMTGVVFNAIGKPEILRNFTFALLVFIAVLIYPATKVYGLVGTAMVITVCSLIVNVIFVRKFFQYMGIKAREIFKIVCPALMATTGMLIVLILMKMFVLRKVLLINLTSLVIIGALVYGLLILLLDKKIALHIKEIRSILTNKTHEESMKAKGEEK